LSTKDYQFSSQGFRMENNGAMSAVKHFSSKWSIKIMNQLQEKEVKRNIEE